ncbi:hypothetical protein ANCCEY_03543 [Ancylostoma ceylanicum]|uniref:Uncharacterized protein n=1 Tax=Ancylostoma ceylanicum TaxID=53326 RepID=A0A0D6LZD1_9BILA|nr:hypothetical protein ANCCEY_03543 [Ancylostoma ceylanicum]
MYVTRGDCGCDMTVIDQLFHVNSSEAAPITREYLTLLSQNYENGSYAFCGGRIHVALLTKIISIGVIPFYALILTFMVHFGNATAIMFAIIILVLLVTSIVLLCALVPILWIAYVVYLDILFIAELDRGLEFMRELNENASNDDVTPKLNNF